MENIAALKREIHWARDVLHEMDDTLSGCDWCCGGGAETYADIAAHMEQAKARLAGLGHAADAAPQCIVCRYYDQTIGDLCPRCDAARLDPTEPDLFPPITSS